jgi:hypothetical protein
LDSCNVVVLATIGLCGHREELTISNIRTRPSVIYVAVAAGLVVATVILRGKAISCWDFLNPDEAELMAQARAALLSPVPFSTWVTGTTGPYWPLFLAGLGALGAPLTLAFAHLLSAVLLALTAAALFVAASRASGPGPAIAVTIVWWFPIAAAFAVGGPQDFSALSTEYLPTLLVVASALVPREHLASRPWLFAVLGLLAGFAAGAKYQVGPLAVAFAAAQLIVLRLSVTRIVVSMLWWLAGLMVPAAAIALVMVASSTTNWTLVEQTLSFLASYANGHSQSTRVGSTVASLLVPRYYLLVGLAGLMWLGLHSERRSNVARVVLVIGGLTAMLIGGMGFPHYLILLFGAGGLAATMPVKPGVRLFARRLSPAVLAGALAVAAVALLVNGYLTDRWRPLSPRAAAAAFTSDSVNRNPELARACPPGSLAVVWGWAAGLYVAQDWQSTMPYLNVVMLSASPANRKTGEPVVRAGIDEAECVVETTSICTGCPSLPAESTLPRFYPKLITLIGQRFHTVQITGGCNGCSLYVRDVSSRASAAPRRKKNCASQRSSPARGTRQ